MKLLLVFAGLALLAPVQESAADILRVAEGIYLLPGRAGPDSQPDGNSTIIETDRGLLLVDTGRHPNHTARLLRFAADARKPVTAIINTHWHLDHISGNAAVRNAFPEADVYASTALDGALRGFLAKYDEYLRTTIPTLDNQPEQQAALTLELERLAHAETLAPTRPVTASSAQRFDNRLLEIHLEHAAVTAGDVWLFDPATRTLIAGDLVTLPAPFFDTACPSRWQAALAELSEQDFDQLVPGHGRVLDRKGFETWRTGFDALLACSASTEEASTCITGWLDNVRALVPEREHEYARSLLHYYIENVLRKDAAALPEHCATS